MFERIGEDFRCRQDNHEHQRKLQEEHCHAAPRDETSEKATQ
jgi:hypothetical protein